MDEINKHLPTGEHCEEWIGAGEFENSAVVWLKDEKTGHYKARLRESVTKPAAEKFKVIPAPLPIEITDAILQEHLLIPVGKDGSEKYENRCSGFTVIGNKYENPQLLDDVLPRE